MTRTSAIALVSVLWLVLAGCPTPTGNGNGDGNTPSDGNTPTDVADTVQSTFTVTKTAIPVRNEASLKVSDQLIAFGTDATFGVSYIVPTETTPAAHVVPGTFHSVGFGVAGAKIILADPNDRVNVFDSATQSFAVLDPNLVVVESVPDRDNTDIFSPIIADGNLVITRNRTSDVTDHRALKVVDVGGAVPVIVALANPPDNVNQVAISATEHVVVAEGVGRFFFYNSLAADATPQILDVSTQGGLHGPFAYNNGFILYVAEDTTRNMRLLNVATGAVTPLTKNPANRDHFPVAAGGKFAYFLQRDALDTFSNVARAVVGTLPGPDATVGGVAGLDPTVRTHPWAGFGDDAAITPDGHWIFIAGDEDITAGAEFLQVSSGGAFQLFADGSGFLNASDVVASAKVVAFKTGTGTATTVAYIRVP